MMDRQLSSSMASWDAESGMASRCSGVDCVFLSCFDHNALFLASMLGQGGIRLHRAHTAEMADFMLLATRGTVLVLDTTFLDGSWEDALAMIGQVHPLVATLICADLVDRKFIAGARERGALDVLWRPIELDRLQSSIWTAHEVTLERRLWLAEREYECLLNRHSVSGFRLETVK
jgi:DNA-binding NtrC family response regulator